MDRDRAEGAPLERSYEETFRRAYQPLVRVLSVAAGNREVAADCVQEAFVRAYTRWRKVGGYDDPVAWIRRVALNLLIDHERHAGRGRRAVERLGPEEQAWNPEPDAVDLSALFAQLPPQRRIAAALFYVDNLSVEEVAHAMKLSAGAVKYHLHEAREQLRPLLAPVVEDEA